MKKEGKRSGMKAEHKGLEEELIRLSSAVKASIDSIVLTDLEGKIIEVNEATLKMYGADDEGELIGKSALDLIAPEDRERAFAGMEVVVEKGHIKSREYHVTRKDSSRLSVEMSVALIKDAEGQPIGFVGISRDITERKRMEKALLESQARFRAIFERAAIGIALVDLEGRPVESNPTLQEMLG